MFQMTIAKKIYASLGITSIAILFTTIVFFYQDGKVQTELFVKNQLESTAQNYFDSINTMMLTGTMAERQIVQSKLLSQEGITEARIIRAPIITSLYGTGFDDQKITDDFDKRGLAGEQTYKLSEKNGVRFMEFIMPIRASSNYRGTNCLSCHQSEAGEVLGAVKLSFDLTKADKRLTKLIINATVLQLIVTLLGFGLLSYIFFKLVLFRLKRLRRTIEGVAKDLDLSKEITIHHHDELGDVNVAFSKMLVCFKDSFLSVSSATNHLITSAKDVDEIAELSKEAVLSLKTGTESVAAAINELDASASEIEQNSHHAADKSTAVGEMASQGLKLTEQARVGIDQLRDQVIENTGMITQLNKTTHEVGAVLEIITGIAEQTNLLALNAAIEAARAGEQGRGFAVVADEVRSLAFRTRESVDQIQQTIASLRAGSDQAVNSMTDVSQQAQEKAADVEAVLGLLANITSEITELDEMNSQNASAAEQQNLAIDEINVHVLNIKDVAEKSSTDVSRGKQVSAHLLELAYELNQQVSKFKLTQ